MDTSEQLHEIDATGWRRGVYDDIQRTFRAPFVNWIFRTAMANVPSFLRYAWWQLKPIYETRAFARFSVEYRDAVLSAVDDDLERYRRAAAGVAPAEYRELRGQLATFDVLAPRLAVLFETMHRSLEGGSVGTDPAADREATAPAPAWLDADRGTPPTMVDEVPPSLSATVESIREFHGLTGDLPSIYRCLAQWPSFLERLWIDHESLLRSDAFERTRTVGDERTAAFVERLPARPRLTPSALHEAGFAEDVVGDVRELFRRFEAGPAETVVPALPLYAASVDAAGARGLG